MNRQERRKAGKRGPKDPPAQPAEPVAIDPVDTTKQYIREGWDSYRDSQIPYGASLVQITETKRGFYAGAGTVMILFRLIGERDEITEDIGEAILEGVQKEIDQYISSAGSDAELSINDRARAHHREPDVTVTQPNASPDGATLAIPEKCSIRGCGKESAFQVGFLFYPLGHARTHEHQAEAWSGVTECEDHEGYSTKELMIPKDGPGWAQLCAVFDNIGRARPDWETVEIRRRGL